MRDIHISIVSHGHGSEVEKLLCDLQKYSCTTERIQATVTLNVAENWNPRARNYTFPLKVIINEAPKGYGANHNHAYLNPPDLSSRQYYVVINPDVEMVAGVLETMAIHGMDQKNGVIAPMVVSGNGEIQDNARPLPTVRALLRRVFGQGRKLDFDTSLLIESPDWVAGMMMFFRTDVFEELKGFDERYYMYYEDVDICTRAWLAGYKVSFVADIMVRHDGRRQSHHDLQFAIWHITSIVRFFLSKTYHLGRRFHIRRNRLSAT